jgi:uncharacterized membrane protein
MRGLLRLGLGLAGVCYPLAMYASRGAVPAIVFVAVGLLLIAGQLATLKSQARSLWLWPLAMAGILLVGSSLWDAKFAAKGYPVVISLAAAFAFGRTLVAPPSFIERIARLQEPDLAPEGQQYCRHVTLVWTGWLLFNAAVAAALAGWGSDAHWTLWTGLVSYIVMAALLGGEIILRKFVRGRNASA